MTLEIDAGAATDLGRVRERNEDGFLDRPPLYAVADGLGGHRGGEVASALALQTLAERLKGPHDLVDAVHEANRAVFDKQARDPSVAGMGTTLTAVIVSGDELYFAHVGDSRAYLLRDGELKALTEDHTLVQELVNEGRLSADEARAHPQKNILTRALGIEDDTEVDEFNVALRAGDRVLLCTDGLTGMLEDREIKRLLETSKDPKATASALVVAANDAGGIDNTTTIVLDVSEGTGEREAKTAAAAGEQAASKRGIRRFARRPDPVGGALIVLAISLLGIRVNLDGHWFVGVENGHVAIFRGLPATFAGIKMYGLAEGTDLTVEALKQNGALGEGGEDELERGIPVASRTDAQRQIQTYRLGGILPLPVTPSASPSQ